MKSVLFAANFLFSEQVETIFFILVLQLDAWNPICSLKKASTMLTNFRRIIFCYVEKFRICCCFLCTISKLITQTVCHTQTNRKSPLKTTWPVCVFVEANCCTCTNHLSPKNCHLTPTSVAIKNQSAQRQTSSNDQLQMTKSTLTGWKRCSRPPKYKCTFACWWTWNWRSCVKTNWRQNL